MNVVTWPIHDDRLALHPLDRSCQIREEFCLNFIREVPLAFVGTENRVNENAGVGMRHRCRPSGARRCYDALDPHGFRRGLNHVVRHRGLWDAGRVSSSAERHLLDLAPPPPPTRRGDRIERSQERDVLEAGSKAGGHRILKLTKQERSMGHRVCPWWLGYLLASPLRRMFWNPVSLLAPYVREGMTVLEPGPGMGFFTLELARLVGPSGKVEALDIQLKMLDGLKRRAAKAGLLGRIDARLAKPDSLGISDVAGADFALAFAVVHELPAVDPFFTEIAGALKSGAFLLLAEPKGHVKPAQIREELESAARAGLTVAGEPPVARSYSALLRKG